MENKRQIGNHYENIACKYLKKNGYRILDRNYNSLYGEIDIICEKDDYIIFIEVKYRSSIKYGYPNEAVDIRKQNKIKNTSLIYISENNIQDKSFRYDVIGMLGDDINHIENAFW